MSQRLACAHVPLFPLAARLRSEPELREEALAILQGNGTAARTVAATRRARRAGVRPGMTLPQARALLPRLKVRARDEACERAAQETLLEIAETYSPRIEDGGEGIVYLEIDGLERHFPGAAPERELAHALTITTEKASLPTWVGIAGSKLAARVAAELPSSPTIVPAGEEAAFLAPLPLHRLSTEAEVLETLRRWGLRSIGELASLSGNEVTSRLGDSGRALHQRARGMDPQPLVPYQPPSTFTEGMDLEWPLVALEPFLFVARAALDRLGQRLTARGLACARLEVDLELEPDGFHRRSIQLPAPTRDIKTLLTLMRLDLEAHPPAAAVIGFTLMAHPDRPREAQLSLFGPPALSPDRLATTLAKLFAQLGPGRIGSPRPVDSNRPEGLGLVEYHSPAPPDLHPEPRRSHGLLAVRVLRPPVPLEVATAPTAAPSPSPAEHTGLTGASAPIEILCTIQEGDAQRPRIEGSIRVASGPWALEDEWWSQNEVEREYWDVELERGGLFRIFRQTTSGEWFADGIYD